MSEIHDILAQHFSGESSADLNSTVEKFKLENPKEYQLLKQLWEQKKIQVKSFDTEGAYNKILSERKDLKPETKTVSIYSRLAKVASIAAAILMISFFAFQYLTPKRSIELVQLEGDGSKKEIKLDDGSTIYLNKGAKLSYPKNFADDQRLVKLEGEAYFSIARDENRPFKITTVHSEVEVLGTSFNIDTRTERTEVAVTSGKVQVTSFSTNEQAILIKDQGANIDNDKLSTYQIENQNFIAWKTGIFSFKNEDISSVVNELNTYYKSEISLLNMSSDCPLNARFEKNSVAEVLEIISLSCNLIIKETNGNYELN